MRSGFTDGKVAVSPQPTRSPRVSPCYLLPAVGSTGGGYGPLMGLSRDTFCKLSPFPLQFRSVAVVLHVFLFSFSAGNGLMARKFEDPTLECECECECGGLHRHCVRHAPKRRPSTRHVPGSVQWGLCPASLGPTTDRRPLHPEGRHNSYTMIYGLLRN